MDRTERANWYNQYHGRLLFDQRQIRKIRRVGRDFLELWDEHMSDPLSFDDGHRSSRPLFDALTEKIEALRTEVNAGYKPSGRYGPIHGP